jgi:hypothetical protein
MGGAHGGNMNRRQSVLVGVLLAVVAAALVGFGSVAVIDSLSGAPLSPGAHSAP